MDAWKTTMEDNKNTDGWNINIYSPGNFIAREIKFEGPVSIGGQTDNGDNTEGYIMQVCLSADVMPDDALPDMDEHPYKWIAVVRAMCEVECGHQYLDCIPENDYIIGWHLMELATGARR